MGRVSHFCRNLFVTLEVVSDSSVAGKSPPMPGDELRMLDRQVVGPVPMIYCRTGRC